MPCYSAHNVRIEKAHGQDKKSLNRAKTALRSKAQKLPAVPSSMECQQAIHVRGYDPHPYNKNQVKRREDVQVTTLPKREFERIKNISKTIKPEEKLEELVRKEKETRILNEEASRVREYFKEIDDARKAANEASTEKEDLIGEKLQVLERAFLAKHEQEQEVKKVNQIILNAKCHAVRDAQLQEKAEIDKRMRDNTLRLEQMVLNKAKESLVNEDTQEEKKKESKIKYAQEIRQQLIERENFRFLEAERIDEEAKMWRKANEAYKLEEDRQAKIAQERRLKFREELRRISQMSELFKKMLCEQEREAELRIVAYMREKEQRQRELDVQKRIEKESFERKQQRLFTLAHKILESRSSREEMSYLREQERMEREYRREEKEAAQRKRQLERDLALARERQLQETKHRQAVQMARDEKEFNELMKQVKEEEAKQKDKEDTQILQHKCYREDIIRQMNDKEFKRRNLLDQEKNEAFAFRERERQREKNIRAVIQAKLDAMRSACLPEKYIKDVEKQLEKIGSKSKSILSQKI